MAKKFLTFLSRPRASKKRPKSIRKHPKSSESYPKTSENRPKTSESRPKQSRIRFRNNHLVKIFILGLFFSFLASKNYYCFQGKSRFFCQNG